MFESMVLLAQSFATAFLAGWMFTGVKDNWLLPRLNGDIVGMILRIDKFAEMYPDEFHHVAHRRVAAEWFHRAIFRFIVLWETLACVLLSIGAIALFAALFGAISLDLAQSLALLGALVFTSVWAGFLIFGNHWVYWYCHEWGQNSHFQLLLWGLGTMVFLALPTG